MTCKVIAEIGINYNSFEEAAEMIFAAKKAGSDYVKFQLFNKETIKDSPLKDRLEPYILKEEQVVALRMIADKNKIGFILTPMYLDAVALAAKYGDLIKIRYKDHENTELIKAAYETGKQLLISVPMRPLNSFDPQLSYLYCLPLYPPEPEDFSFEIACVSDGVSLHYPHTVFDLVYAINRNREEGYIEKHVMLYRQSPPMKFTYPQYDKKYNQRDFIDDNVSITFDELTSFINQLKLIERMKRYRF